MEEKNINLYETEKYKSVPKELKTNNHYCSVCGSEMRYHLSRSKTTSFDTRTRERKEDTEKVTHLWVCPEPESNHDSIEFTPL